MMGIFLNPDNTNFQEAINSKIYVDKTGMISELNQVIRTENMSALVVHAVSENQWRQICLLLTIAEAVIQKSCSKITK